MTTFVVSLFLPYTIDFHGLPTGERANGPARTFAAVGQNGSTNDLHASRIGLFSKEAPISPKIPTAADHQIFFAQFQPSAASHFSKPFNPRTLVRSDSNIPEWGHGLIFNQPRSNLEPSSSNTILEYAKTQERFETQRVRISRKLPSGDQLGIQDHSEDRRWTTDWSVVPAVHGNGGLTNAIRASIESGELSDVLIVGTIGFPTDVLDEEKKAEIHDTLESEHEALTVYVSDTDFKGHYTHYCKTILWPVFHYQIPDHPKSKAYEDHSWIFYVNINQAFADKVVANYKRGDIIWIHDYHLCLVPIMVRTKIPDAQIGFFLHTAFPSSEVFRCLATRKDLLEGMLGANLVAFQTHEYAHHFLQTCSRILSFEATEDGIQRENHFVNVWWYPIGINPRALALAREELEVMEWIKALQERYAGKRLIVARDKLDSIRGVRQKLLAFELFLNKYPEWKDKVVLCQVATSTTEDDRLASTTSEIVTRIDAVHSSLSHNPLVFLRQDITFSQYLALLSVADVLMVTSLREGMNLTCHEFVICQDGRASDKKHSPVILSEFTGSASIFEGAELSVNPWDYQKCADAICVALNMDGGEKYRRYCKLRNIIMRNTGNMWITKLKEHLAKVYDERHCRDTMSIPRLNINRISQTYQTSNKRLFLLDYEGTLAPFGPVGNTVLPNMDRVTNTLNDLILDEKNLVYVMGGRTLQELEMLFSRVPGVGLIAENGCFLREIRSDDWTTFIDEERTTKWKEAVKSILKYYVERVEGSWIEDRHCSLTLHYENTYDPESTTRQAGDCANHINDACEGQHVRAIPTKNSVIIEQMDCDKATAAAHIISSMVEAERPDFIFVAGNDRDDEVIFRWAKQLSIDWKIREVYTVSVGNRNTVAMSTLTVTQGTTGLITALAKLAKDAGVLHESKY